MLTWYFIYSQVMQYLYLYCFVEGLGQENVVKKMCPRLLKIKRSTYFSILKVYETVIQYQPCQENLQRSRRIIGPVANLPLCGSDNDGFLPLLELLVDITLSATQRMSLVYVVWLIFSSSGRTLSTLVNTTNAHLLNNN